MTMHLIIEFNSISFICLKKGKIANKNITKLI